jgi:DNA polymerase III epsilon subunit family exonuclease
MTHGVTLDTPDTQLTHRAATLLAAGPADAQTLISYVCQLPGAPPMIAEHMATALFAGHGGFTRDATGRWRLKTTPDDVSIAASASALALECESFIVVDVEATGSAAYRGDRIVEIAAVRVHNGTATTVFNSLINPQRPIPRTISRLTTISSDMVRNAPTFRDICGDLLRVLEGQIFVGHNVEFDWRFINMEVQRVTSRRLQGRRLCTVRMAKRFLPQLRRRSLDHVSWHFGIENEARHRAGGDAEATAKVLVRLLRDARTSGCETYADLEEMMVEPSKSGRRRRRRGRRALPHSVADDASA